jgi:hypothetical protein
MDDRELEARLRTRLHQRFDGASPSPELAAVVQQAITTPPRRLGAADVFLRAPRLGWAALAAAALVAVVAVAGFRFGGILSPGADNPTPQSTAATPMERQFVVLPLAFRAPSKAESDLAGQVLADRLRALGIGSFTSTSAGAGLAFVVPVDGPSDESIRHVLGATGDIEFVPLPPEHYGEGKLEATVGERLPKVEPALFGWDGIASVERGIDAQGSPTLELTLTAAARVAFATYTEDHVNEVLAILIDGEVVLLPLIQEPVPGGQVSLSGGGLQGDSDDQFDRAVAILVGGMLPEFWHGAVASEIRPREIIVADLMLEVIRGGIAQGEPTVRSADLDSTRAAEGWRAVWRIVLDGSFQGECLLPGTASPRNCASADSALYVLDATTGEHISSEFPAS